MTATLSYEAIYDVRPDILDGLELPDVLDADDVKNKILFESIELEALYPDPDVIKKAVEIWSKSRLHTWEKIAAALYKNYDPFINFTRDELRTETETRNLAGSATNSGTDTSTNSAKAYNSNAMTEREQDTLAHGKKTATTDTGTISRTETFHSQGDSAMFTPTDIAGKETALRMQYDLISIIVNEFISKFCLLVY